MISLVLLCICIVFAAGGVLKDPAKAVPRADVYRGGHATHRGPLKPHAGPIKPGPHAARYNSNLSENSKKRGSLRHSRPLGEDGFPLGPGVSKQVIKERGDAVMKKRAERASVKQ